MKSKILLVLNFLFGLMFINSGFNKFFNYMPMPEDLPAKMAESISAFETIGWLMPLVGTVEIIGGILCLSKRYRTMGHCVLFPIIVGIMLTHIFVAPSGLPIAVIFLAINAWNLFEGRAKYLSLLK